MNTKINVETKLKLLDFLQCVFETHKATVKKFNQELSAWERKIFFE